MYSLLIKNGTVVTVDPLHTIHCPGFVAIQGDSIAAIGPMEAMPDEACAARVIDASGHVVMPGLVDGHGHAGHCIIKILGLNFGNWPEYARDVYSYYVDDFFWYAEGALAAAERVKFGVTTGVSMLGSTPRADRIEFLESHFEGALKTGLRQISGIGACDGPWPKPSHIWENGKPRETTFTPETVVENTEYAVKHLNGRHKRQICIPMPGNVGQQTDMTDEQSIWMMKQMSRIRKEYGTALHTHSATGKIQFVYDHIPELLMPTTSLTHSTGLTVREQEIIRDSGAYVFHGPTTHANIFVRCPVYELLRLGANVAIVTDGTAPDRSYDLWRDMKVFQVIHRIHENNPWLAPHGKVLEMCTIEPAKALGIDKIAGSLEVGKRADVILVNMRQPHLMPRVPLTVQQLVGFVQGQDVDTSIIDGEIVMENRKLLLCDEDRILDDAQKALDELFSRLGKEKLAAITDDPYTYDLYAQTWYGPRPEGSN